MAGEAAGAGTRPGANKGEKLARLPRHARIEKRPLIRPTISSPYAGPQSQKVVYLSSKTPFMSAFKRVKQLLKHIDKRQLQSEASNKKQKSESPHVEQAREDVKIKATGKAIEKAMNLALWLQQQSDCNVEFATGSVYAIDDIVESLSNEQSKSDLTDLPESRIRQASVFEVSVSLR